MLRHLALALAFAAASLPAAAHDYAVGELRIEHPWARAMPPMTKVGAGYLAVENAGEEADRLVSVESPRSAEVQIHESTMEGDVARMREITDGVEIPAGGSVTLEPGGLHLMFTGVEEAFAEGGSVAAVLTFEKAGPVEVEFRVAPVGAGAPAGGGEAAGHSHDTMHGKPN